MAKTAELTKLKKGTAQFNLVGEAKVKDFTFKLDTQSQKSDWIYNQMNLGVDCGAYGVIYADLMGGYGAERQNELMVHGKKDKDGRMVDDFTKKFKIDWDDRFDEDILETVGDMCFITVGLEKTEDKKVFYKKFLSQYDAIQYISDNLEDGDVINVKGNLVYSLYNENVQVKKEITSLCLSKAEPEKYKATFTQMLLLDSEAVGKLDKETLTIPIYAKVIDYVKEYEEKLVKTMLPLAKTFDIRVTKEEVENVKKFLKLFKAKNKTITALTVEGEFTRGEVNTVEVNESDIPDEIKELIELGYIDKDEILNKMALANGGGKKPEKMVVTKPHIKFNGEDVKIPTVERVTEIYTENDVCIPMIIESLGDKVKDQPKKEDKKEEDSVDEKDVDDAIDSALAADVDDDSGDDDAWLADL